MDKLVKVLIVYLVLVALTLLIAELTPFIIVLVLVVLAVLTMRVKLGDVELLMLAVVTSIDVVKVFSCVFLITNFTT